jgi:hypothetical protein
MSDLKLLSRAFYSAALAAGVFYCASAAAEVAGTVSFLAGEAQIQRANGQSQALSMGTKIDAGDRIATGPDGHVYVTMVDGAFVVVRPKSRLHIEDYYYDAAVPANNRIKLSLEEGVVRSVTGRAGEASKQSYRFNTPLAAIGIRGTDFVVQADSGVTRVAVQSGAIVMSPLGGDCLASTLGPCDNPTTRVLTAAMRDAYLELRSKSEAPRLIPGEKALESPNIIAPPRPEESRVPADKQSKTNMESDGREVVREVNAGVIAGNVASSTARPASTPAPAPSPVTAPPVVAPVTTAPPPVVVAAEPAAQFWWGRWSTYVKSGQPGSFASAMLPGRELAVANDVFVVAREPGAVVMPNTGVVNFRLAESEAYIVNGPKTIGTAQISNPSLKIDFGGRRYDTALTVKSADLDPIAIQSSGKITFQGYLSADSNSPDTTINGVLSKNSEQAAYVFQRSLTGGQSAVGATRWTQ